MIDAPKVSIIIPVFNGSNFLREAINSALSQSYPNLEIIVVNDGSTDSGRTERIALSYGDRVRYLHKENGGVATALNLGISRMTGEYFSWLSHDDMYTPDKISKQIEAVQNFGAPAIAYCDNDFISPEGELLETNRVSPKGETSMRCLLAVGGGSGLHGCSLLIPRSFFERFGQFNPNLRYTQDYDLWFRMAGSVPFVHVNEVMVISRRHVRQDSRKYAAGQAKEVDRMLSQFIRELSAEEIAGYYNGSVVPLITNYREVLLTGQYGRTGCRLLARICAIADETGEWDEAAPILDALLVRSGSENKAMLFWERTLKPLIRAPRLKPRILLYMPGEDLSLWREWSGIINLLSNQYEWILAMDVRIEQQVADISLPNKTLFVHSESGLALRLAALHVLLDADLFIGVMQANDASLLDVYEVLQGMGIRSIMYNAQSYFQYYSGRNALSLLAYRSEAYKSASAVIWADSFSANVYARIYGNAALIPASPVPDPSTGLRWDRLIQTVMEAESDSSLSEQLYARFMETVGNTPDFARSAAAEYTRYIPKLLDRVGDWSTAGRRAATEGSKESNADQDQLVMYARIVEEMSNTVSWKVTRPLRWSKRLYHLIRRDGVPLAARKAVSRIHSELGRIRLSLQSKGQSVPLHIRVLHETWSRTPDKVEVKVRKWRRQFRTATGYSPGLGGLEHVRKACRDASSPLLYRKAAELVDGMIFQSGNADTALKALQHTIKPLMELERTAPVLLFHIYGWGYGGAERLVARLSSYMANKGYNVLLAMFEPIRECEYYLDPRVTLLPIYGITDQVERLQLLVGLLRPDLFIGNNNIVPELAASYSVFRRLGIASIAYSMEYFFFPHHHFYAEYCRGAIARSSRLGEADVACFLTSFSANSYRLFQPNAAVMPPMSTFDIAAELPEKHVGKTILAVGRFNEPLKRLDRVIQVFKQVLARHADANLVVVGLYDLDVYIPENATFPVGELLERLAIPSGQIQFAGLQGQIEPFYRQADVLILTSDTEGFPMVLTEAGSRGLPLIINEIPGLEDVVIEGENGHIVPQGDIQGMADKVADLFDNPDRLRLMSRKSLELAGRFAEERIGPKWERLIQSVLSSPSREVLNRLLADEYMYPVQDEDAFARHTVIEYEKMAAWIASKG